MHVLRPLYVVLALAAIILIARSFWIPNDFGTHEQGYTYGWYRQSNIEEWKNFTVKYRGREFCGPAMQGRRKSLLPHSIKILNVKTATDRLFPIRLIR